MSPFAFIQLPQPSSPTVSLHPPSFTPPPPLAFICLHPPSFTLVSTNLSPLFIYLFIYLFTSFSGHKPAQRECARKGLRSHARCHLYPIPQPVKFDPTTGVYDPYCFRIVMWVPRTSQWKCSETGLTVSSLLDADESKWQLMRDAKVPTPRLGDSLDSWMSMFVHCAILMRILIFPRWRCGGDRMVCFQSFKEF